MIELNLLPDIKLDYIKTERTQRLVVSISLLVSAAAIALLLLLLSLDALQKTHLNSLSTKVSKDIKTLQDKPQINTILTVQNQLKSLTNLYAGEPAAPRLFTYLNEVTPVQVGINTLSVDFNMHTINIDGNTNNLASINQYVDTLKLTTYTTGTNNNAEPAFSSVVLSSFGVSSSATDPSQAASYNITLSYDQNIFDVTQKINLTVPNTTTTRLNLQQPSDLFNNNGTATSSSSGGGQ